MKLIKRHLYTFFCCVSLSHSPLMDDAIESLVYFLPEMNLLQRLKYDMHIFMCFYHVNGWQSIHTLHVFITQNINNCDGEYFLNGGKMTMKTKKKTLNWESFVNHCLPGDAFSLLISIGIVRFSRLESCKDWQVSKTETETDSLHCPGQQGRLFFCSSIQKDCYVASCHLSYRIILT